MVGREPALLSTKRLSAASSRDALSASAWDPYGHFYPWEPSWDQRELDLPCSPCMAFLEQKRDPALLHPGQRNQGGVMEVLSLDLPVQTAALAVRAKSDSSSFLPEVKRVLHSF